MWAECWRLGSFAILSAAKMDSDGCMGWSSSAKLSPKSRAESPPIPSLARFLEVPFMLLLPFYPSGQVSSTRYDSRILRLFLTILQNRRYWSLACIVNTIEGLGTFGMLRIYGTFLVFGGVGSCVERTPLDCFDWSDPWRRGRPTSSPVARPKVPTGGQAREREFRLEKDYRTGKASIWSAITTLVF